MPLNAVEAALRGELFAMAAELTATHLVPLVTTGTAQKLERLLVAAPPAVVLSHPELAAGLAAARVILGRTNDLDVLVEAARGRASALSPRRAARLEVVLDIVTGAGSRLTGELDLQLAAYRRVPADPAALASLGFVSAEIIPVVVHGNRGAAALWTGDLQYAENELVAADSLLGSRRALPHFNARSYLALLQIERGELDQAEATAEELVAAASSAGFARVAQVVGAYLALARLQLDRDELGTPYVAPACGSGETPSMSAGMALTPCSPLALPRSRGVELDLAAWTGC
jgi:LuxR family maltose regulon positive regulatory protein